MKLGNIGTSLILTGLVSVVYYLSLVTSANSYNGFNYGSIGIWLAILGMILNIISSFMKE